MRDDLQQGPHQAAPADWIEPGPRLGGATIALTVVDGLAYVGEGRYLAVYDVSQPAQPRRLSRQLAARDTILDIEATSDRLYVAHPQGVEILDRGRPEMPRVLGRLPEGAHALAAQDDLLLLAWEGVRILSMTDPVTPKLVAVFPEPTEDLLLRGEHAFLATSNRGVVVLQLAPAGEPRVVAEIDDPWEWDDVPVALAIEADQLYVQAQSGGVFVTDISNPRQPRLLYHGRCGFEFMRGLAVSGGLILTSSWFDVVICSVDDASRLDIQAVRMRFDGIPDWGDRALRHVEIVGEHAFLAGHDRGLLVLDLGDPSQPEVVASTGGLGASRAVDLQDGRLLGANQTGLSLFDARQAGEPSPIGRLEVDYLDRAVDIQDDWALAGGRRGLGLLDLEAEDGPSLMGRLYDEHGAFGDLDTEGDLLFVAAGLAGLQIFDLGDPGYPRLVQQVAASSHLGSVRVRDGVAYVTDGSRLRILSVEDPARVLELGHLEHEGGLSQHSLALRGDRLFASGYQSSILVDVSDPSVPREVLSEPSITRIFQAEVEGDRLYLYCPAQGIEVHHWSAEDGLTRLGQVPDSSSIEGFAVQNEHLFVARANELTIFDLAEVEAPTELVRVVMDSPVTGFQLDGDRMWLAERSALHRWDIANPRAPVLLDEREWSETVDMMAISGDRMHGINWFEGWFGVFEFTGSEGIQHLGSYRGVEGVEDLVLDGQRAVLAAGEAGLRIVDLSDPTRPVEMGYSLDLGDARAVAVAGDHALVIDETDDPADSAHEERSSRVVVFDLSDPRRPRRVHSFQETRAKLEMTVDEGIAYVAEGPPSTKLHLYDVGQPTDPRHLGSADWVALGEVADLEVDGEIAWMVSPSGLRLFDVRDPGRPCAIALAPGPRLAAGLAAENGRVFVAEGSAGLSIHRRAGGLPDTCHGPAPVFLPLLRMELRQSPIR